MRWPIQLAIAIRHARLYEEVHAGRERLLALSRRLVGAQEDERRMIARELHDGTGQALTAAMMNLQVLRKGRVDVAAKSLIDDTLNIIEQTLQRVRNLSLELRPSLLDDLGLVAALRWYVDRQARRAGFDGLLVVEPACHPRAGGDRDHMLPGRPGGVDERREARQGEPRPRRAEGTRRRVVAGHRGRRGRFRRGRGPTRCTGGDQPRPAQHGGARRPAGRRPADRVGAGARDRPPRTLRADRCGHDHSAGRDPIDAGS